MIELVAVGGLFLNIGLLIGLYLGNRQAQYWLGLYKIRNRQYRERVNKFYPEDEVEIFQYLNKPITFFSLFFKRK